MFWTFMIVVTLGVVLIKLGAATVMVSMLTLGLQGALIVIAILVALFLWRHFSKRNDQPID